MDAMEKIVSLCKRRGFIFPSSEIYGGLNGAWDYGPLGVELKRNLKQAWWDDMVAHHDETATPQGAPSPFGMVGLDSSLLMNPKVWEASGHVGGFSDPMVDDRETRARYRADQLAVYALEFIGSDGKLERYDEVLFAALGRGRQVRSHRAVRAASQANCRATEDKGGKEPRPIPVPGALQDEALRAKVLAPGASAPGTLTAPRAFNLMFKTHVGALEDNSSVTYLRPETAQGIFVNFKNVCDTARVRVPFGIGQVGKAFRNEINPRNFTFRSREFEQMEIEFFCRANEAGAVVRVLARAALSLVSRPRHQASEPAPARARSERARALRRRLRRHRVRLPVRPQRARGHREPQRFRSAPAHADERQGPALLRRSGTERGGEALPAARHRAVGRGGPRHAGVSLRRLQRGRGRAARRAPC